MTLRITNTTPSITTLSIKNSYITLVSCFCVVMLRVIILNVVMLRVIILNVVMLRVIILNAVMLRVIILNVVMLIVVAPFPTEAGSLPHLQTN
jgi:hypothetical protein